jgi:hypothetical protein
MYIAYASSAAGFWYKMQGVVDPVKHNITVQATHFTVFAILADTTQQSSPALAIGWSLTGGIIGGLTLLAVILYFGYFRAQRIKPDTEWRWTGQDWVPRERKTPPEDWIWDGKNWVPPKE